jgi:DNA polymerase-1
MKKKVITTFDEFLGWMCDNFELVMALDFETTSLDYMLMEPVGFSLCNGRSACYVPYNKEIYRYMGILLGDSEEDATMWIMHNAAFDLKCIKKFMLGVTPRNIFCSLVGAKLLNENLFSHGLKYLAEHWLKIPVDQIKKWEEVSKDVSSPEFMNYSMNDSIWCWQLYEIESKALKKQGLEHVFYNVEMPFQFVLRDLEINGVATDKEKLEEYKNECYEILIAIESDMLRIFDKAHIVQTDLFGGQSLDSPINFGSTPQLVSHIEQLGLEIVERTKPSKTFPNGQKSVDKNVLARLKGEHEFIDLLIRYRKLSTMYSTFIGRIEDFIDSDGRVRPSYNMVRTGRLSCSKPNLQNQPNPKKEKLEFNYRKIFIAGD